MTQQTLTTTHPASPWYAEVRRLLAKSFIASQGVYREGKMVSVHMAPHQRAGSTTVDLAVAIFPRLLPAPTARTMAADRAALAAFLRELRDTDYHVRLAACEALGHLGDPEARAALQAAEQDAHQAVRAAATRALAALDTPRLQKEDLAGLGLVLVRHEANLRQPLDRQSTDRRGHVWFRQVPAEAVCAVHMLGRPQAQPHEAEATTPRVLSLAAEELPAEEPRVLEARSKPGQGSSLPQTQEVVLDDGRLVCELGRDTRGQVVIKFLTNAPQLQAGWVLMTVVSQPNQVEALREFIPLLPYEPGIVRGSYPFSAVLSPGQGYEIHYEPIPGLGDTTE
jgi:hypothetical protein